MKYFLLTENQEQFLNSEHASDPANPAPICVILMRSSWYSGTKRTSTGTAVHVHRRSAYCNQDLYLSQLSQISADVQRMSADVSGCQLVSSGCQPLVSTGT